MKMVTISEHEKLRSYMQRLIAGDEEELDENDEAGTRVCSRNVKSVHVAISSQSPVRRWGALVAVTDFQSIPELRGRMDGQNSTSLVCSGTGFEGRGTRNHLPALRVFLSPTCPDCDQT